MTVLPPEEGQEQSPWQYRSKVAQELANVVEVLRISYGAREPLLSNKRLYPNFFRTVPSNKIQYAAYVKLLERFQWNWVGIITTDDDSGRRELQELVKLFTSHQICIEFTILIVRENLYELPPALQASSTDVIIICGSYSLTYYKFLNNVAHLLNNKTLILPSSWSRAKDLIFLKETPGNCSLLFSMCTYNFTGKEFFNIVQLSNQPSDPLLEDIWMTVFHCYTGNKLKDFLMPKIQRRTYRNCSEEIKLYQKLTFSGDITPYQVYIAVYIMAQALHRVHILLNNRKRNTSSIYDYKNRLAHYIKEKTIVLNENGDWNTPLDILNWVTTKYKEDVITSKRLVGSFDESFPEDKQLDINPQIITWRQNSVPKGRCNDLCPPGTRKVLREGYHICCYDCVPCPEGEFTNHSDSENCQRCPEDEWPNVGRNTCVVRFYEFLSYESDVALVFSLFSILFSLITVFIIGIFTLFRKSPIVRANNQNLSFLLLTSLMFSLLCVFLFIGRPVDITCMLRQIFFGIFFTVAVSSVLAKTIIVCIAFKATRPDSSWRKCVGVKLPYSVVLVCSSLQILNAVIWLSLSPPYQELNLDYPGKIIIQCNEGSVLAFYLMLGYMGFLAAVSFVLAFMVRTLPDIYNEAKYITFSMLVFCSVWIGAIPAYLSSTGKHMVTVEIFAILASVGGILICMFLPKCYNIMMEPEMKSKGHLSQRLVL
ncbi:vomeronasal type-2 receptor 26-like [Hyla sarda]|uniref:vomeronasal type-2 receptor 26-like n=1 Tax=Hyla sarda TaxID=327740 RepID=UPI0024C30FDF|nr:vomeronasal type-2 receptor 26-like [Hyla sarda]